MSAIISEFNDITFKYINKNIKNDELKNTMLVTMGELFKNIRLHYDKKSQFSAPEMLKLKAIESMYKFMPHIKDGKLNEIIRNFWNRFLTKEYFKNDYNESNVKDKKKYYYDYSKKLLNKYYNNEEKIVDVLNKFKKKMDEDEGVVPLIIKLIEDDLNEFIIKKSYNVKILRSDDGFKDYKNVINYTKDYIDFYDEVVNDTLHKSIIFAFV